MQNPLDVEQGGGLLRIAWAFLRPIGADGKCNVGMTAKHQSPYTAKEPGSSTKPKSGTGVDDSSRWRLNRFYQTSTLSMLFYNILAATYGLSTPCGSPINSRARRNNLAGLKPRGLLAVTTPSARVRSCIIRRVGFCFVLERFPRLLTQNHSTSLRMLFIALLKAMRVFPQGTGWLLRVLNLVNPRDRGRSTAMRIMSSTHQPPHGQPDIRSKLQLFEYRPLSILERWQARRRGFPRLPSPSSPEVPDAFLQVLLSRRKRCGDKKKESGDNDPSQVSQVQLCTNGVLAPATSIWIESEKPPSPFSSSRTLVLSWMCSS